MGRFALSRTPSLAAVRQVLLDEVRRAASAGARTPNAWTVELSTRDTARRRDDLPRWSALLAEQVLDTVERAGSVVTGVVTVTFRTARDVDRGAVRVNGTVGRRPAAPPPHPPGQPRLVLPAGGTARWGTLVSAGVEDDLPLHPGRTLVGRARHADVQLSDTSVSPEHACLEVSPDGAEVHVRDLGSLNGTRVDGRPVAHAPLVDGSRLQLGAVPLVFRREPADDDAGRQGGGPHREQVSGSADDAGTTGGAPVGPGPATAGLRRTPNVLWAAVALMILGLVLVAGAVVALSGSRALAVALLLLGAVTGLVGAELARRHRIMEDVE